MYSYVEGLYPGLYRKHTIHLPVTTLKRNAFPHSPLKSTFYGTPHIEIQNTSPINLKLHLFDHTSHITESIFESLTGQVKIISSIPHDHKIKPYMRKGD